MHIGMQIFLNGLYKSSNASLADGASSNSYCKLFPVVQSNCCDTTEWKTCLVKYMGFRLTYCASRPCECCMEDAATQNIEGGLSDRKNKRVCWGEIVNEVYKYS